LRSVIITGLTVFILFMVPAGFANENVLDLQVPLSIDYTRAAYEDWTVQVDGATIFVPTDGSLPDPFYYSDLQLDMPVIVEGMIANGSNLIYAQYVYVFGSMNKAAQMRKAPMLTDDSIFGPVTLITPESLTFNVWVDEHQGDYMDILVLPGSQFWDAPVGLPRTPLNSIYNFCPGDPIMIHGYSYNDMYRGSVFVRSDDWFPGGNAFNSMEIAEVYGWVDNVYLSHHGNQFVTVLVDCVTGDPNHQTFSKVVGPEGGYVHFPWGYLNFPAGALDESTNVVVSGDFMFWWTLQNIYDFQPDIEFNVPVPIEIRYFNLENINPDRIKLTYFDEEEQCWKLACHMTHYPDEHCFRGQVEHFSRYSLSTNNRPLQEVILQPN